MRMKYRDLAELVDKARKQGKGRQAIEVLLGYLNGELNRSEALRRLRMLAEAR